MPAATLPGRTFAAAAADSDCHGNGHDPPAAREAAELVRELIDRIIVTPTDEGEPMKLGLIGNVAALLEEQPSIMARIASGMYIMSRRVPAASKHVQCRYRSAW